MEALWEGRGWDALKRLVVGLPVVSVVVLGFSSCDRAIIVGEVSPAMLECRVSWYYPCVAKVTGWWDVESKRAKGKRVGSWRGRSEIGGAGLGGVERNICKEWGDGVGRVVSIDLLEPCQVWDGNGAVSIELNAAGKDRRGEVVWG